MTVLAAVDLADRDGLLAGSVLVGTFILAGFYLRLAYLRSKELRNQLFHDDRAADLLLGILLIGIIATLAIPRLLNDPVVAGVVGSIAGFIFGRNTTSKTSEPQPSVEEPSTGSSPPDGPTG